MAWNEVATVSRGGSGPVKLGTLQIKSGEAKTSITLDVEMFQKLGKPARCNAWRGDGADDDASSLLLQFDADGSHQVSALGLRGARLLLPLLDGAPAEARKPHPVTFAEDADDAGVKQLIITLPW